MEDASTYQHYTALIFKEQLAIITEAEKRELTDWLEAAQENRSIYERLNNRDFVPDIQYYRHIDIEKGLRTYRRRHPVAATPRPFLWRSVAAVLVLLAGLSVYYTFRTTGEDFSDLIRPGSPKAVLVLNDGSEINLEDPRVVEISGDTVFNSGTQINYRSLNKPRNPARHEGMHELRIPRGGEYLLQLEDGTRISLNSQSTIKYPVRFAGGERVVYLKGEAYFEVAKDSIRPFRVVTDRDIDIEVLGTCFNVKAYEDEDVVETVLEEGSGRMKVPGESVVLAPGERSVFDRAKRELKTEKTRTQLYTAWRKGQFVFDDEPVESILNKLSRWYNIDVFYENPTAKRMLFNGNLQKYDDIHKILNAIEKAGKVRFKIQGKLLTVYCSE